jgi:hypothetical protein
MLMRVKYAWIKFLEEKYNARAVEVNGDFKVVPMTCETCLYKNSDKTKHCQASSSVGCHEWKHKEAK